jgi:hypothetical protein
MRGLTRKEALGAVTVVSRACAHSAKANGILAAALRADLPNLAVPAVEVTVQAGGPLGRILADVLADADAPMNLLMMIYEAIPFPTLMLAAADVVVTKRITDGLQDDADPAERARWNDLLSGRLAQTGHLAEALRPAQEAVAIYRELADASPGQYEPDLLAGLTAASGTLVA